MARTLPLSDGRGDRSRWRAGHLLRDLRGPLGPRDAADHGPRDPDGRLARRLLRRARGPRLLRDSPRQPRHRALHPPLAAPGPVTAAARQARRNAPYTLADMAADSIGVLDHLGIEQA